MGSFSNGFIRPTAKPENLIEGFQDIYAGQELTLLKYVPAGKYIYGNEDVFIDDGGAGQVIPSIYNATAESEMQAMVSGVLKSYGIGIKQYTGFTSSKATGWSKPSMVDFYNTGTELGSWVPGIAYLYGEATKNADHLYLKSYHTVTNGADHAFVTDEPIDLDMIQSMNCDMEKVNSDSGLAGVYFVISRSKMSGYATYDARADTSTISRQTFTLDTSSMTGLYYVRVHARTGSSSSSNYSEAKVYRVWGEL